MKRIVTISREFGSGGRTVGNMVAEQLGWPCYDKELVIKTDWWRAADVKRFTLEKNTSGWVISNDSIPIARISGDIVNPAEARTFQMAEELRKTLASLADATFRLQLRTKDFSCEPLLNEANRVLRFIERG